MHRTWNVLCLWWKNSIVHMVIIRNIRLPMQDTVLTIIIFIVKNTAWKKYSENPYRAVNFTKDADGNLICSNGQKFLFKRTQPVKYSKYGRTEELYECESCEGCPHKQECCPRAHKNRTIRMNQELTAIHQEVLNNLTSIHGALLRMNRSIQSERTFGVLKWDKSYKRLFRRGEKNVILELALISCGFNLYKYHNKKRRQMPVLAFLNQRLFLQPLFT